MAITANTGSSSIPTREEVVSKLFSAAKELPSNVDNDGRNEPSLTGPDRSYTIRGELLFYDFVAGRFTTLPHFGRTVFAGEPSSGRKYNSLVGNAMFRNIQSRIARNRVQLIEWINLGMSGLDLHLINKVRYNTPSTYYSEVHGQPMAARNGSRKLILAFSGYVHPDAISDERIVAFSELWPNYRELAADNSFFQHVVDTPAIADRIDACLKDSHERLLSNLPKYLKDSVLFKRQWGSVIGDYTHLLSVFSREEILDEYARLFPEVQPYQWTSYVISLNGVVSKAGWKKCSHDGIEAALTTILQKGHPRYADNYLAESIELLELAHCFGMTGYGLQISADKTYRITEDMSWLTICIRVLIFDDCGEDFEGVDPARVDSRLNSSKWNGLNYRIDCVTQKVLEMYGVDDLNKVQSAPSYDPSKLFNSRLGIVRLS